MLPDSRPLSLLQWRRERDSRPHDVFNAESLGLSLLDICKLCQAT